MGLKVLGITTDLCTYRLLPRLSKLVYYTFAVGFRRPYYSHNLLVLVFDSAKPGCAWKDRTTDEASEGGSSAVSFAPDPSDACWSIFYSVRHFGNEVI
jgi:hypothetical protein